MSNIIIRNAWTNRLVLRDEAGVLSVAPPGAVLAAATWTKQPVDGTDFVQFCDSQHPTTCLNVQNGQVALSSVEPGSTSAMWTLKPVDGSNLFRIQNRQTGDYLNNQKNTGALAAGPIEQGWVSAMWAIDDTFVPDARSVHLQYVAGPNLLAVYNEVTAIESQKGTYFSVIGFNGGYTGIQELPDGSKIAIFSVWDNGPNTATIVKLGPGVKPVDFGGEGTGQSARMRFPWNLNQKVAFAVAAQPTSAGTDFSAFYRGDDDWVFLATISRPGTHGSDEMLLGGLYSFVEDFLRNGATEGVAAADRSPYQSHVGNFSNPWVLALNGTWSPISDATFTAVPADNNPLTNIDAKVLPGDEIAFQLATGGERVQSNPLNATLHSPATPSTAPNMSSSPPPLPASPFPVFTPFSIPMAPVLVGANWAQTLFGSGWIVAANKVQIDWSTQSLVTDFLLGLLVEGQSITNNLTQYFCLRGSGASAQHPVLNYGGPNQQWLQAWNGQQWVDGNGSALAAPVGPNGDCWFRRQPGPDPVAMRFVIEDGWVGNGFRVWAFTGTGLPNR